MEKPLEHRVCLRRYPIFCRCELIEEFHEQGSVNPVAAAHPRNFECIRGGHQASQSRIAVELAFMFLHGWQDKQCSSKRLLNWEQISKGLIACNPIRRPE